MVNCVHLPKPHWRGAQKWAGCFAEEGTGPNTQSTDTPGEQFDNIMAMEMDNAHFDISSVTILIFAKFQIAIDCVSCIR